MNIVHDENYDLQALKIKVNPIYLLLPATVCSSYAFMLPAATPPNAIVLGAAGIRTSDMVSASFFFFYVMTSLLKF